ncbi:MAG: TetR/AcrR family transcriptional regulator [Phyllobacteriaceae bacterium]|nr:TetR/AcrR family transcriptional regulator [Phyllobacteriaceae bacterium]
MTRDTAALRPALTRTPRRSGGPRRSDTAHAAILDAAEALLTTGGPSAVTFEAVARAAGAGKPTLYRWWPDRIDLLLEVYDRQTGATLPEVDTGSFEEDLIVSISGLWRFWRESVAGRAFAAVVAEAQFDETARSTLVERLRDPAFPLRPVIARAVTRGEITPSEGEGLREFVVALNWLRLLTDRLDETEVPALVAALLAGRGRRRPA